MISKGIRKVKDYSTGQGTKRQGCALHLEDFIL